MLSLDLKFFFGPLNFNNLFSSLFVTHTTSAVYVITDFICLIYRIPSFVSLPMLLSLRKHKYYRIFFPFLCFTISINFIYFSPLLSLVIYTLPFSQSHVPSYYKTNRPDKARWDSKNASKAVMSREKLDVKVR